jgi:hypothetical protein
MHRYQPTMKIKVCLSKYFLNALMKRRTNRDKKY